MILREVALDGIADRIGVLGEPIELVRGDTPESWNLHNAKTPQLR